MLKISIRTCVVCRSKFSQKLLNRLQCIDKQLIPYTKNGRSFYLCDECLEDETKLEKTLYRQCKNKDNYIVQLREIFADGRQS